MLSLPTMAQEGQPGNAAVSAQVAAAETGALAVPELDRATLVVTGEDRVTWLNGLVTADLLGGNRKGAPDAASYGLAVGRNGRVLSDLVVVFDEARLLVAVPREAAEALRAHLDHYLVMEDAELAFGELEAWSIHGPASAAALDAARAAGAAGGLLDATGLGGAFVLAPSERAGAVRAALASAATIGDWHGWEALRLERGVPRFGVDFDDKTYPQEAGLERTAVSFDKGCYLGQEVVCMLELRGHVKRKLAALVVDAGEAPSRGAEVTDAGGAVLGEITSAARSPTPGKSVALAMIKRAQAVAGQDVIVGGAHAAVVARPV